MVAGLSSALRADCPQSPISYALRLDAAGRRAEPGQLAREGHLLIESAVGTVYRAPAVGSPERGPPSFHTRRHFYALGSPELPRFPFPRTDHTTSRAH